ATIADNTFLCVCSWPTASQHTWQSAGGVAGLTCAGLSSEGAQQPSGSDWPDSVHELHKEPSTCIHARAGAPPNDESIKTSAATYTKFLCTLSSNGIIQIISNRWSTPAA